jgi:type I restriction enzyme S subunit
LVNGFPFDSAMFNPDRGARLVRIRDLTEGGDRTYVDGPVPANAFIYPGDLVIGMDGDFNSVTWRDEPAALNQRLCVLRGRPSVSQRFLSYLVPMPLRVINDLTYFTTVKHLSSVDLLEERIPLPPLAEQEAIADYLDRETARIDALIVAKQRMLSLLDEKWRGALDAVVWSNGTPTGALMHLTDPARPVMYGIVLPGPDVGPEGVAIVKGGDVAQGRLSWDLLCKTTAEIEAPYKRARLRGGDLVYAIRGGIGDVALVPEGITGANITQDVARISPRSGVDARWLMYALQSPAAQSDARRRVTGATITGLNIWELDRVRVPLATAAQQLEQRVRLDALTTSISRSRKALTAQCNLLQERRRALVTAAVTGQIDMPVGA